MKETWTHKDHPDDERYDKITIDVEPRWKESELSGDEWRFSYVIKAWRKGYVIVERSFSRLEWALQALQYTIYIWVEDGEGFNTENWNYTKSLCDQLGCDNKGTIFYQRLKPYTRQGHELVPNSWDKHYRQFCERHRIRGDCDLDDADANYKEIPNPNKGD